jgi:hypothetical protein
VDAALGVAAYLQRRAQPASRPLFALRSGDSTGAATFAFASEYARGSSSLGTLLAWERHDAAVRVQKHWEEVLRKQKLAALLRSELSTLQSELSSLKAALDAAKAAMPHWFLAGGSIGLRRRVEQCRSAVCKKEGEIGIKQRSLEEAERAPPPVIQPLPQSDDLALSWIFFLHMPQCFRHLSRISFLAQQMLLPRPCSDRGILSSIEVSLRGVSAVCVSGVYQW